MSKHHSNGKPSLEDFVDDTQLQQTANCGKTPNPWKKKPVVTVLLSAVLVSAVLVAAIAILLIQVFRPFDSGGQTRPEETAPKETKVNTQNSQGAPPKNGGESGGGVLYGPGPNGGGEDGGGLYDPGPSGGESGGGILSRQGADGTREYSTDGGKTWSKTPPAGVNVPGQ